MNVAAPTEVGFAYDPVVAYQVVPDIDQAAGDQRMVEDFTTLVVGLVVEKVDADDGQEVGTGSARAAAESGFVVIVLQ